MTLRNKHRLLREIDREIEYFSESLDKNFDDHQISLAQTRSVINYIINQ